MHKQLLQVGAFMRAFGQPVRMTPATQIPFGEGMLRTKLTEEEFQEYQNSMVLQGENWKVDVAHALDGLADRLYVLLGDAHALGLGLYLPVAFRMVHESNMTKMWTNEEIEELTKSDKSGYSVTPVKTGHVRCYLVKDVFGKVIKSPSYKPADFVGMLSDLEGQGLLDFDAIEGVIYGTEEDDVPDVDELYETVETIEEESAQDS